MLAVCRKCLAFLGVAAILCSGAWGLDIRTDTTWSPFALPGPLSESVYIFDGATLTIEPGTTIQFTQFLSALRGTIDVRSGGALVINGAAGAPVTVTSAEATPAAGDWGRIHVRPGASASISHCNLTHGGDDSQGSIYIQSSAVQVNNCTIANGVGSGVFLDTAGVAPQIDDLTVTNCAGSGIRLQNPDVQPTIGDALTFSGNGFNGIFVDDGSVTQDTTWTVTTVPYGIEGYLRVENNATLTMQAGVEVSFFRIISSLRSMVDVRGGGNLQVLGTAGSPVLFTSAESDAAPGDWAYVRIEDDGSADISSAAFSHGGDDSLGSLWLQSDNVLVRDCSFSNGLDDAIRIDTAGTSPDVDGITVDSCSGAAIRFPQPDVQPVIGDNLTFTNNGFDGIHVSAGSIAHDTTWTVTTVPYGIEGHVFVETGVALTVQAGVEVGFFRVFSALRSLLQARGGGSLQVEGTVDSPVRFTSVEPDAAPGDWAYVRVDADSSANINHAEFVNGGDDLLGSLWLQSSNAFVRNCAFIDGLGDAIYMDNPGTSPDVDSITVANCSGAAIRLPTPDVQPLIGDDLAFGNNGFDAILVDGGEITHDTTWTVRGTPYALRGWVNVNGPASLTLNPGVEVRFVKVLSSLRSLLRARLGGDIQLAGTAAEPVVFTSWEAVPEPGDWAYLRVDSDSSATLDHFTMDYGGDDALGSLFIQSSNAAVTNASIRNSLGDAIRLDTVATTPYFDGLTVEDCTGAAMRLDPPDIQPVIGDNLAFTGNEVNGILVMNGEIIHSTDWTVNGTPYVISGGLFVRDGAILTLEAGVEVLFAPVLSALRSNLNALAGGKIYAPGAAANPVRFGSFSDMPAPGDWAYVRTYNDGIGHFDHCEFQYAGDDGLGTLFVQSSDTIITNCTIRNSSNEGVYLDTPGTTPEMDFLMVEGCAGSAIWMTTPDIQPVIGNNLSFTGNGVDAIHTNGGIISRNTTWTVSGTPYAISGYVSVEGAAIFTLLPGVEVRFMPVLSSLRSLLQANLGGHIDVAGAPDFPVRLTSGAEAPVPGDWAYLRITADSSASIDHAVVSYAGDDDRGALWLQSSNVNVTNCVVESSWGDGIYLDTPDTSPILDALDVSGCGGAAVMLTTPNIQPDIGDDLLFTGNGVDAIFVSGGDMTSSASWDSVGAPYGVSGWLGVAGGAQLTIGPGVTVAFQPVFTSEHSLIDVADTSTLTAVGTGAAPIRFTSAELEPAPGDWSNLSVEPGGTATLEYCVIEYGGQLGEMVEVDDGTLYLGNSIVRHSNAAGLRVANPRGIDLWDNQILDNTGLGIDNDTPATVVDATYTYWGDPSGPYHATLNPEGLGNGVSDGVLFEPWVRTLTPDVTAPVLALNGPAEITLECGIDEYIEYGATATDDIDGDISDWVSVAIQGQAKIAEELTAAGTYILEYTVADSAGNAAAPVTRTVTVTDTTAPEITLLGDAAVSIDCGDIYTDAGAVANDACGGELAVALDDSALQEGVPGTYTVIFTAQDASGNAATPVSRAVTVTDLIAPIITLLGDATVTIDCSDAYVDDGAVALDACAGQLTAVLDDRALQTGVPGTYTLTYTAEDPSGNAAAPVTRTVVVRDNCIGDDCDAICAQPSVDMDGDGLDSCQECLNGTDDTLTDTDGDGMADNFEVENGLDPLSDDADEDMDGDGLSNLEEFLEDSLPGDPNSPHGVYFVSPTGADTAGGGTQAQPWATIGFALSQVAPGTGETARLILDAGLYVEDVVLGPRISIAGLFSNAPVIRGRVLGAEDTALLNVVVEPVTDAQGEVLVEMSGAVMDLIQVVLRGRGNRLATGVLVDGTEPAESVVVGCVFDGLGTGLDIESAIPTIRRCFFTDIAVAGIIVRQPITKAEGDEGNLGDSTDARTGWNSFDTANIDGPAVVNDRGTTLFTENNEWGSNDTDEIGSHIDGPSDFIPFLPVGTAVSVSSFHCAVWDAETQAPITDGTVELTPSSLRPVTDNVDGRYAFHAVAPGAYTVRVEAPGYDPVEVGVAIAEGDFKAITVPLGEEDEPEPPGPTCGAGPSRAPWGDGLVLLICVAALAGRCVRKRCAMR